MQAWFMEHRRDVRGGDLWTCTASSSSRGQESAGGSQGVWAFARYGTEDARVRGAARLPAPAADQAAEAGPVVGRHRRHSERRQAEASQAAAPVEADLRAVEGRARVPGRLHDREGLRAHSDATWAGDVCAADASGRRGTGGFR